MSHNMRLKERSIEYMLRRETGVPGNQLGFTPDRLESIYLLRYLVEKSRCKPKDLSMVFIDLKKAYESPERSLMKGIREEMILDCLYTGY